MIMIIKQITSLPTNFTAMSDEALQDGHRFLQKMQNEWSSGINRFTKTGEILLAVYKENDLSTAIAIGGVNIDPYLDDPKVGRVRHLYIAKPFRRMGIAKQIVQKLVDHSTKHFDKLRLRTHNPESVPFYQAMGFTVLPCEEDKEHVHFEKVLRN